MSFESYKARMRTTGKTPIETANMSSKHSNASMILNSPTRREVKINNETSSTYCIVSDKDGFQKREFLFLPDTVIYKGDYLHYDGLTYLVTKHNIDDLSPRAEADLCNFDFPIKTISDRKIVGTNPTTGTPKWETVNTFITKPCVMTVKSYSALDNSSIGQADVSVIIILPYTTLSEETPKRNSSIKIGNSQYKVIETTEQNTFVYADGIRRGYTETRLQWEANT